MAWNSSGLKGMCRFLLLVTIFLPREMTSASYGPVRLTVRKIRKQIKSGSVLTVNGKTENFILNTCLGAEESLRCDVHNPTGDEGLLWYREQGSVDLKAGNKINSSSICVSSISENDNGVTFTCKLQRDQSVSVAVVLNVTFLPRLSGNDVQTVEEGNSVNVVCNVKSNPQAQMMWYKDGSILNLEKNHHQVQQTSESLQLSISKVKKSDNGTYICVAHSCGQRKTMDFHLFVKDRAATIPIEPIIAATVVVFLTLSFGLIARRKRIIKLCMKGEDPQRDTAL